MSEKVMDIIVIIEKTKTMTNTWTNTKTKTDTKTRIPGVSENVSFDFFLD